MLPDEIGSVKIEKNCLNFWVFCLSHTRNLLMVMDGLLATLYALGHVTRND